MHVYKDTNTIVLNGAILNTWRYKYKSTNILNINETFLCVCPNRNINNKIRI